MAAVAKELQELLLAWEEELMQREEALVTWEEKARILEKALTMVSADLDADRAKAEATQKEYLDKMKTHTAHAKHSLCLDKILGENESPLMSHRGGEEEILKFSKTHNGIRTAKTGHSGLGNRTLRFC
jgi:hypothetical protein